MKLEDLFEAVKSKWPVQIDLSDGELFSGGGFRSWNMVRAQEEAAMLLGDTNLMGAAVWPFHQALGRHARKQFIAGARLISRDEAEISVFARFLRSTLDDPSWAEEREIFMRHNPSSS